MSVAALIVAAGRGLRFDPRRPKQFVSLAGKSILSHSIDLFDAIPQIDTVWLVLPDEMIDENGAGIDLSGSPKIAGKVVGGERRQDSVRAGLEAMPRDTEIVVIHDAVRPLAAPEAVTKAVGRARKVGAAILAARAVDTTKQCDAEGRILETLDRDRLWLAQTPQVFRYDLIVRAYERVFADGVEVTDESMAVERLGEPVEVVPSPRPNPKITTPDDLAFAEWLLARRERS